MRLLPVASILWLECNACEVVCTSDLPWLHAWMLACLLITLHHPYRVRILREVGLSDKKDGCVSVSLVNVWLK